jgi:hypothetical protein
MTGKAEPERVHRKNEANQKGIRNIYDGNLELDIRVNGIRRFEELHGPGSFEKFQDGLSKKLGKILPDFVSLWMIGEADEPAEQQKKAGELREREITKNLLIEILKDPEFQKEINLPALVQDEVKKGIALVKAEL